MIHLEKHCLMLNDLMSHSFIREKFPLIVRHVFLLPHHKVTRQQGHPNFSTLKTDRWCNSLANRSQGPLQDFPGVPWDKDLGDQRSSCRYKS